METVEVMIKLPQKVYLDVKNGYGSNIQREKVIERVKNGIVLPKNHGRLIDSELLDKIRYEIETEKNAGCHTQYAGGLDFALSIIDKYRAESEVQK